MDRMLLNALTTNVATFTAALTASRSSAAKTLSSNIIATTIATIVTSATIATPGAALALGSNGSKCLDGATGRMCECAASDNATNTTRGTLSEDDGSLDALLYIVVVLLFYAFSIVVLMVKYIRRENKEAYLRQYFDDFVAREHFQSAQTRNQVCLKNILDKQRGSNNVKLTAATDDDSVAVIAKPHYYYCKDLNGSGDLDYSERGSVGDEDSVFLQLCIPETIDETVDETVDEKVDIVEETLDDSKDCDEFETASDFDDLHSPSSYSSITVNQDSDNSAVNNFDSESEDPQPTAEVTQNSQESPV